MITTILQWFGWVLLKIYELVESIPGAYAIALIIFTLIIKFILFPLSYKGKKSMMRMTALQGKMKKLEAQYGKDKQRYQEEVQKLYQKENVSPMGGCLWSLLPLPILMGLYYIVRRPMLYMMAIPKDAITTAIDAVSNAGYVLGGQTYYQELMLSGMLDDSNVLSIVQNAIPEYASKLHAINFNLFGINLGETPKLMFWKNFSTLGIWPSVGLFLIPLLVTVLNFWYTQYSTKTNAALTAPEDKEDGKKKKKGAAPAKSSAERSNTIMMWIMPLMYLYFGFIMPAAMCVYMAVNALCTVLQDTICVKILRKSFLEMQEQQRIKDEEEAAELAAKKAEIAERRRLQEEANKASAKKGKKSKKQAKPAAVKNSSAGRIGIRAYALGRDYDPNRYGGVTAYRDPQEIIDEQAIEESYDKKRKRKQEAVEKQIAQAEEAGDLDKLKALEAEQAALNEAEEAAEAAAAEEAAQTALTDGSETAASPEEAGTEEEPRETSEADGQPKQDDTDEEQS